MSKILEQLKMKEDLEKLWVKLDDREKFVLAFSFMLKSIE